MWDSLDDASDIDLRLHGHFIGRAAVARGGCARSGDFGVLRGPSGGSRGGPGPKVLAFGSKGGNATSKGDIFGEKCSLSDQKGGNPHQRRRKSKKTEEFCQIWTILTPNRAKCCCYSLLSARAPELMMCELYPLVDVPPTSRCVRIIYKQFLTPFPALCR